MSNIFIKWNTLEPLFPQEHILHIQYHRTCIHHEFVTSLSQFLRQSSRYSVCILAGRLRYDWPQERSKQIKIDNLDHYLIFSIF